MLSQQKISAVGADAFATEHGQRQPRPHVADIAVAAGQARERRLAQRQPAEQLADEQARA